MASSPIKKSRSSIPRLEAKCDDDPNEEGLEGTEGARDADEPAGAERVAIQVGKTNEGSELPAKLAQETRRATGSALCCLDKRAQSTALTLVWSNRFHCPGKGEQSSVS